MIILAEMSGLEQAGLISSIIVGAGGLVTAVVFGLRKQEVRLDQPLNVKLLEHFVPKSEFAEHVRDNKEEVTRLDRQMIEDRRNVETHASQRSAGIYSKIEDVRKELSGKIDEMPSKIIADLRNAKGLLQEGE